MKNIDRIRAMSTEKLAEWLDECGAEPLDFCETCNLDIKCEDCPDEDWKQIWMKWLEREIGEKREDAAVAAGDTISRQAALDALCNVCDKNCNKSEFVYNAPQAEQVILCPEHYALCNLQPAQPEQRTGEYVHVSGYNDQYKCTACGIDIVPMRVVKFCPECGAKVLKMISGERVRYPWEGAKV